MSNNPSISLSVIVPCYNVEPFLDRSLGSLERQWNGRSDHEIILINDASTDGTINKLNEFKNRYPDHVVVIDKKANEGVAKARNNGLDIARGEWVVFMDPDDALKVNSYSSLLEMAKSNPSVDILAYGVEVVPEREWDDSLANIPFNGKMESQETIRDFMLNRHFATSISYLFRRNLIAEQRFPALMFLEDVLFVLPLFLGSANIGITSEKVYYYIVRQSSTTNLRNSERLNRGCDDVMTALSMMNDIKQGHDTAVQARITKHQNFYAYNLFTRILLSTKDVRDVKEIRRSLYEMSLQPFNEAGLKTKFYGFLFKHPRLMMLFRPVYRLERRLLSLL